MKYKKILIANRGEIAVRIIKALKELDIQTVAVYSTADEDALYTKLADESFCIGPPASTESYLDTYKILAVAEMTEANAVHPGIGFLAENSDFARLCSEARIDFIGPSPEAILMMGNKYEAKQIAKKCKIPVIDGSDEVIDTLKECRKASDKIGYPVLLKATYGGGGKGIRVVHQPKELESNYNLCIKESQAAFANSELLAEQYLENTRHVEVQIIGDRMGNVVHLGDRECTIQRAKQKVIEEARCTNISDELREKLYHDAVRIAKYIHYVGPGTVEFLVLPNEKYYFLEMNTRLQVEHTITELITAKDIVKEQVKVIGGDPLGFEQSDVEFNGYALQCRITAEDIHGGFFPSFGAIDYWHMPGGNGVRVDTGYQQSGKVSPYYDSLLAKVCCYGENKKEAIKKMLICLDEIKIEGIKTNVEFLKYMLAGNDVLEGRYNETYVERKLDSYV